MSATTVEIRLDEASSAARWARARVRWRERLLDLAAVVLGPWSTRSGRNRWKDGAPIVTYHRIVADPDPTTDPFAVREAAFEAQVAWLAQHFSLITVAELAARIRKRKPLGGTAVISFDDGYDCTYRRALPILRALKAPVTLFVATGGLDRADGGLGSAQLAELAAAGVEIGSHGVTHRDLRTLTDAELEAELKRSRERLEESAGVAVAGLAYPYGRFDDRVIRAARACGYDHACSCRQHRPNEATTALFCLNRLELNLGDSRRRFLGKVGGRYARVYEAWYRLNPATRAWLEA
ncbi:MAG: polysaccharide deacetylase family protein [Planctomycetes bacterium]|nr:polysaccharide deacetylase family protein [Planctomycetota bacterium]